MTSHFSVGEKAMLMSIEDEYKTACGLELFKPVHITMVAGRMCEVVPLKVKAPWPRYVTCDQLRKLIH